MKIFCPSIYALFFHDTKFYIGIGLVIAIIIIGNTVPRIKRRKENRKY